MFQIIAIMLFYYIYMHNIPIETNCPKMCKDDQSFPEISGEFRPHGLYIC